MTRKDLLAAYHTVDASHYCPLLCDVMEYYNVSGLCNITDEQLLSFLVNVLMPVISDLIKNNGLFYNFNKNLHAEINKKFI